MVMKARGEFRGTLRVDASALKLLPLRQIIEPLREASKVARDKRYQPEDASDL